MAGTRNSSMGSPWMIDPTTHCTMSERSYHWATSRSTIYEESREGHHLWPETQHSSPDVPRPIHLPQSHLIIHKEFPKQEKGEGGGGAGGELQCGLRDVIGGSWHSLMAENAYTQRRNPQRPPPPKKKKQQHNKPTHNIHIFKINII